MKPVTLDTIDPILKPAYALGISVGREEVRVLSLLTVLEARGLAVTTEQRAKILACTDPDRMDTWLRQAAIARTTEDALAEHQ